MDSHPATSWSQLVPDDSCPSALDRARAYFYERYFDVVRRYFGRLGQSDEEAVELAQAFFANSFEKDLLRSADRRRGRFRAYLQVASRAFLYDRIRYQTRRRRRPLGGLRSLDEIDGNGDEAGSGVPSGEPSPEETFDRDCADAVVESARKRLEGWCSERGETSEWTIFEMRYFEGRSSKAIAERIGRPVEEIYTICRRLKAEFGKVLREEVATTVHDNEVEDELEFLMSLYRQ